MVSIDKFWVFIVWENKIKWFAIPYLLLFLSKVRGYLEMLFIEKSICTFLGSRASSWTDSDDKCYKLKTFVQPGLISSSSIPHINRWKKVSVIKSFTRYNSRTSWGPLLFLFLMKTFESVLMRFFIKMCQWFPLSGVPRFNARPIQLIDL